MKDIRGLQWLGMMQSWEFGRQAVRTVKKLYFAAAKALARGFEETMVDLGLAVWTKRMAVGAYAVLDQGLFSLGSFLFNIGLARWLVEEEYGSFVLLFTAFHIVGGVHNALVVEPFLIFGAGQYRESLAGYFSKMVWAHAAVTVPLGLLAGLIFLPLQTELSFLAFWSVLAAPPILLSIALRKTCYVHADSRTACLGSAVYLLVGLVGLAGAILQGVLRGYHYFLIHGIAGILVATLLVPLFLAHQGVRQASNPVRWTEALRYHWRYGKWSAGAWLASSLNNAAYIPVLSITGGLAQVAYYRSAENLLMPLNQTVTAFSAVVLPRFSRLVHSRDIGGLKRSVHRCGALLGGLLFVSILGLYVAADGLSSLLYDGKYEGLGPWILGLGIVYFARSFRDVGYANGLRALQRNQPIFFAVLAGAAFSVTAGIWLVTVYEMTGVVIARGVIGFIQTVLIITTFYQCTRGAA